MSKLLSEGAISRRHSLKLGLGALAASGFASRTFAKTPKKLGVALVGLGYYSRDLLAPALQLTEHCELRGIVTGSPNKIPEWQKKYSIADGNVYNYDNMHEVANNPDIDVLYIVVPTFLHKKFAVIAANAGKHVWCEKPMAMTTDECEAIISACKKNKVQLTVGYRLQHETNTRSIMQLARKKPFGQLQSVVSEAGYAGRGAAEDNWRMDQSKGGGAIYDMGVYPINAARYGTAMEPIAITAQYKPNMPEKFTKADDTTYFSLEFKGGLRADCATSVTQEFNQLKVNCEKGWYELAPMQSYNGVKGRASDGQVFDKFVPNQQARQMDDDALAILGKQEILVPGEEGLKDIHIVRAAIRSAESGGKRIVL